MPLDEVVIFDADANIVESPFDDVSQLPPEAVSQSYLCIILASPNNMIFLWMFCMLPPARFLGTGLSNVKSATRPSSPSGAAGFITGFSSMKCQGVFLLPTGWNASPLQGCPEHLIQQYPFTHLSGERHCESKVS